MLLGWGTWEKEGDVPKYLLVYYGGKKETGLQQAEEEIATWNKWLASVSNSVVDAGAPAATGKVVGGSGIRTIGGKAVTGYSIIQAGSLELACGLARQCPVITDGGQVAVYALSPMM